MVLETRTSSQSINSFDEIEIVGDEPENSEVYYEIYTFGTLEFLKIADEVRTLQETGKSK